MLRERNLIIVLCVAVLGLLLNIISVSTSSWIILQLPEPYYRNGSGKYMLAAHSGLWTTCRTVKFNISDEQETATTQCDSLVMFQGRHNLANHPEVDAQFLDYRLTSAAFSVTGLLLMVLGLVFGTYSLREPRYMFKRLAAFLFILCAACVLVSIEVLMTSLTHAASRLPGRVPKGTYHHYGSSFYLAWIVFVAYMIAGLQYLINSRKRKDEIAADVPTIIGR